MMRITGLILIDRWRLLQRGQNLLQAGLPKKQDSGRFLRYATALCITAIRQLYYGHLHGYRRVDNTHLPFTILPVPAGDIFVTSAGQPVVICLTFSVKKVRKIFRSRRYV